MRQIHSSVIMRWVFARGKAVDEADSFFGDHEMG
jgi:hypothetical protein